MKTIKNIAIYILTVFLQRAVRHHHVRGRVHGHRHHLHNPDNHIS